MGFTRGGKDDDDVSGSRSNGSTTATRPGTKDEAFLGHGSKVVGTLNFSGPVTLDGYIEGEIHAKEHLTVGEAAVINARIVAAEVVVRGTVNGDIVATRHLALRKPAKVVGNISAACLSIEEGVVFEGKCAMNDPKKPVKEISGAAEKPGASAA